MVGDSLTSDIKGGNDYGIDTCWFNPTGRPADDGISPRMEIAALSDLLDLSGAQSAG